MLVGGSHLLGDSFLGGGASPTWVEGAPWGAAKDAAKGAAEGVAQSARSGASFSCSGNEAPIESPPSGSGPQCRPHGRRQGRDRNFHSDVEVGLESLRAAHFPLIHFFSVAPGGYTAPR